MSSACLICPWRESFTQNNLMSLSQWQFELVFSVFFKIPSVPQFIGSVPPIVGLIHTLVFYATRECIECVESSPNRYHQKADCG